MEQNNRNGFFFIFRFAIQQYQKKIFINTTTNVWVENAINATRGYSLDQIYGTDSVK